MCVYRACIRPSIRPFQYVDIYGRVIAWLLVCLERKNRFRVCGDQSSEAPAPPSGCPHKGPDMKGTNLRRRLMSHRWLLVCVVAWTLYTHVPYMYPSIHFTAYRWCAT